MNAENYDDGIVTTEAPSAEECAASYLKMTTERLNNPDFPIERLDMTDIQQMEVAYVQKIMLSQLDVLDPLYGIFKEAHKYLSAHFDPQNQSFCELTIEYLEENKDMWCEKEGNADMDIVEKERVNDCIKKLKNLHQLIQMMAHKLVNPSADIPFIKDEEAEKIGALINRDELFSPAESSVTSTKEKSSEMRSKLKWGSAMAAFVVGGGVSYFAGSALQVIDPVGSLTGFDGVEDLKIFYTGISALLLSFQVYFIANYMDKAQTLINAVSDMTSAINTLAFKSPEHAEKLKRVLMEIIQKLENPENQKPLIRATYLKASIDITNPSSGGDSDLDSILPHVNDIEKSVTHNINEVLFQKNFLKIVGVIALLGLAGTGSVLSIAMNSGLLFAVNRIFVSIKNPRETAAIKGVIETLKEAGGAMDSIKSTVLVFQDAMNLAKGGKAWVSLNERVKYVGTRVFEVIDKRKTAA